MLSEKIDPCLLGFDFDGVVADTAEAFLRLACEKYGHCEVRLEDITHFDVEECLSIQPQVIQTIFHEILMDSVGTGLQPMPGAVEVLGELTEKSTVTLITARARSEPVEDWLRVFLPVSATRRVKIVAMGLHEDKERYVRAEGLQYFIDDRAETCLQLSRAGISPFVFYQPWNHGRHSLPSVRSWEEIRGLCF